MTYIVYTVFCKTFYDQRTNHSNQVGASAWEIVIMIVIIAVWIVILMAIAWGVFRLLYRDKPEKRVFALYGCTHKTVAMGIPLITAMYETDPRLALYTLPLIVWHPTQLIIGSFCAPRLSKWVEKEKDRLSKKQSDDPGVVVNAIDPTLEASAMNFKGGREDVV